jgi:hypothetical protein
MTQHAEPAPRVVVAGAGRNRITALVNMSSRYLTWQHGGGLIVGDGLSAEPPSPGDPARPA